jgi:hypothetical protein
MGCFLRSRLRPPSDRAVAEPDPQRDGVFPVLCMRWRTLQLCRERSTSGRLAPATGVSTRQHLGHKVTCRGVGVDLVIAASARKHGVSDEDIRHAYEHPIPRL